MNNKSGINRIDHVDIARGIAIILVVLGHGCFSSMMGINRLLLSFHMPLFFFLSGVFAKLMTVHELWGGVKSRAQKLLIPQIALSLTIILLKGVPWLLEGKRLGDFDFISCFCFWFLPVLFICSVSYMVVSAVVNIEKRHNRIVIGTVSLLIAATTIYTHVTSNWAVVDWFIKSAVAFLFYICGSFMKERVIEVKEKTSLIKSLLVFLLIPVLIIISQMNSMVLMYKNEYGHFPLFLASSFVGIYIVVELSKRLADIPFLKEMGRLSIAVYVWNFLVVGFMMRLIYRVWFMLGINNDYVITMTTFIVSILILYPLSRLTYNYLPFMYGMKRKKHD